MNYLGTMSILDRGDAPAQAVIDRNSRALAQRVANETEEELEKVMHRVENICDNFEMTNEYYEGFGSNMEFVSDIAELAELLQDQVKKKKYQAQVTVFIVGFQEVSSQKLKLLQQVNEFFLDSIRNFEDDLPKTPDVDLEDVTHKIDESLDVARGLANRLGDINQDIIEYLIHYAENKAKNKGRKKLEKALQAAKDDLSSLSEKLLGVQSDLEEKDEKMQQLYKQLEIKTLENQKYRSAAEVAKKNLLDAEKLKDDIVMRDEKLRDMRQVISRLEIDLTQARHSHEQTQNRLDNASMESQQKLMELKKGVDGSKMESNEAKREMEKIHEHQIKKMLKSHDKEIEDLKQQHDDEIEKLMEEIDSLKEQVLRIKFEKSFSDGDQVRHFDLSTSTESSVDPSRQSSRQDSRAASRNSGASKSKGKNKSKLDGRENSDVTESDSRIKRSKSTLETVDETDVFDNVYDLKDEESWARIPAPDVPGRFKQYRKLTQSHVADLEDKLQVTLARMHRKVQTLKGQFQEHKTKWDTERKILMGQVNQAQDLQKDAEDEADTTITQLENFITEQEKLEIEEARKRQEMAMAINSLNKVVPGTSHTSGSSEDDIQKLMQQTDDAKALATSVGDDILIDDKSASNKEIPDDGTDDDMRLSSAKSRQSLRSMYKSKIEESKKLAEDRKHKSAALKETIKEVKDSEEKFDEDQEDYLKGFGFSATGELLPEHPVVQEYIKTYNIGMAFKDALAKTLLDKDMMSASQVISDIEVHRFRHNSKVLPQLENMTKSLNTVLGEIITLLNGILINDRDPAVSSVMFVSRDPTMITPDSSRTPLPTRESHVNLDNVDNDYVRDLQQKCNLLHKNLEESSMKHEDQLRHNTVVMMGMQETINGLQRELSTLCKAPRSRSVTPLYQLNQAPSPDTSIMFTRLDAERNAKIMKKAVNDDKLDQNKYKEAVSQMDKYISLPAQRLSQLVRKYVHHNRMKYIEENVQKNQNLDEGAFEVLDKMEDLQNERAKRWAEKMDAMGTERLRMANLLMETLDSIENESGIFLIKPMYSYRSRELQQKYNSKLSRPVKSRKAKSAVGITDNHSTQGPVNTPASNIRNIHREITLQSRESTSGVPAVNKTSFEGSNGVGVTGTGVSGVAANWVGSSSNATWNVNSSQSRPSKDDSSNFHNTPRILELDINRMLIGQNNISTRLSYPLTNDRLTNATQNTLRTYVTVNRPSVQPTGMKDSSAPPSTPQPLSNSAGIGVRNIDNSSPKLPSTPPLPPINKHRNLSASSSRQSPPLETRPKRITSGFTATTSDYED